MMDAGADTSLRAGWVRLRDGVEIRPLVEGAGTALVLYRMEGGVEFPLHSHAHPEYGTVILGRGHILLEDGKKPLNEGDSYYIPSNVPHGALLPPQPNPLVVLHVVVTDGRDVSRDMFEEMVREARATLKVEVAREMLAQMPRSRTRNSGRRARRKSATTA
jgi:quercetin dioxygenase-like cupin family protein